MTVLCLAGPIGDDSAPFHDAARRLRDAGFEVLNPAESEPAPDSSWEDRLAGALAVLLRADAVAVLPGSGNGRGIMLRLAADLAKPIRTVPGWLTKAGQDDYMRRLRAGGG